MKFFLLCLFFSLFFLPFAQALILLGSSLLIEIPLFENFKMVIMTSAFLLVSLSMTVLIGFALLKAALGVLNSPVGRAVKHIVTKT